MSDRLAHRVWNGVVGGLDHAQLQRRGRVLDALPQSTISGLSESDTIGRQSK